MPHLSKPTFSLSEASEIGVLADAGDNAFDDTYKRPDCNESEPVQINRINSAELFGTQREIEIDHEGRIYRLRLTHLNKLILTA